MSTLKAPSVGSRAAVAAIGLALAALVFVAALGSPPRASAAEYEVSICPAEPAVGEKIEPEADTKPPVGEFLLECPAPGLNVNMLRQTKRGEVSGGQHWVIAAPEGTTIHSIEFERSLSHTAMSFMEWRLLASDVGLLFHAIDAGAPLPANGKAEYTINSSLVSGDLLCPFAKCPGGDFSVELQSLVLHMEDKTRPVLFGPLLPSPTVRGVTPVSYSATDAGSGIEEATLYVDGQETNVSHDGNGGRCERPFLFLVPCRLSIRSSFQLDTTTLSEGQHEVQVSVADASGETTKSAPVKFNVRNAPANTEPPAITGPAKVEARLTATAGRWLGSPTGFAYQWLRCPPSVKASGSLAGCVAIAGATRSQYRPGASDLNQRLVVKVTATNAAGSGSALSAPTDIIAIPRRPHKPPLLSHIVLSRKRFRVGSSGLKSGRGAVLSFSSSRAGHLTLTIERGGKGRKLSVVAKLAAPIKSGRSSVLLTGQVGSRVLAAGRYRITLRVKDAAGSVSNPARVSFTILPG